MHVCVCPDGLHSKHHPAFHLMMIMMMDGSALSISLLYGHPYIPRSSGPVRIRIYESNTNWYQEVLQNETSNYN